MASSTARAVLVEGPDKPFVIREVPVPAVGPGQVLVRMLASGVCPTDTSIATGTWLMKKPRYPYVPGHEGVGYIAATAADVRQLREGDRVGVFWLNSTCGACEWCHTGRENLCLRQESTGYTLNGTHADYCVVSADYVVRLPEGDATALTPFMCAGVTSYKAVKDLAATPGQVVVVVGVGATGHLAIQFAHALGLKVVALDIDQSKLELARSLDTMLALDARQFPVNRVNRETGGAHGIIVTAPHPKAFEQGLRMLRRGGTCVLVGVAEEMLALPAFPTVINEHRIVGTVSGTRRDLREALEFARNGQVKAVVETRPLEAVNDAVKDLADQKVKGRLVLTLS